MHKAIGFEVEFIAVGFLKRKDRRSDCPYGVECFIKAGSVTIKDSIQILTVDAYGGGVTISEWCTQVSPWGIRWYIRGIKRVVMVHIIVIHLIISSGSIIIGSMIVISGNIFCYICNKICYICNTFVIYWHIPIVILVGAGACRAAGWMVGIINLIVMNLSVINLIVLPC